MVRIKISNNTKTNTINVPVTTTLKAAADEAGVNLGNGGVYLNGQLLAGGDKNSTLEALGVEDESEALLVAIKNADSAF